MCSWLRDNCNFKAVLYLGFIFIDHDFRVDCKNFALFFVLEIIGPSHVSEYYSRSYSLKIHFESGFTTEEVWLVFKAVVVFSNFSKFHTHYTELDYCFR